MKLLSKNNENLIHILPREDINQGVNVKVYLENEDSKESYFLTAEGVFKERENTVVGLEALSNLNIGDMFVFKVYSYSESEYPDGPDSPEDINVDLIYQDLAMVVIDGDNNETHSINANQLDIYTETDNDTIIIYEQ